MEIDATSPLLPWLVRHASWLLNRYLVHGDGLTSYQRRWGKPYGRGLCKFSETVLYRDPGKHVNKLQPVWSSGIWLGKDTESDETLVGTTNGVLRVRSIRRLLPSEQFNLELLTSVVGLPWAPQGSSTSVPLLRDFLFPPGLPLAPATSTTPEAPETTASAGSAQDHTTESAPSAPTQDTPTEQSATSSSSAAPSGASTRPAPEAVQERPTRRPRIALPTGTLRPRDYELDDEDLSPNKSLRISGFQLPHGTTIDIHCNEDITESTLVGLEHYPFPDDKLRAGMLREMKAMKDFNVYEEVASSTLPPHTISKQFLHVGF